MKSQRQRSKEERSGVKESMMKSLEKHRNIESER